MSIISIWNSLFHTEVVMQKDNSRKQSILNFVNEYFNDYSSIPTVRDIAAGTGIPVVTVQRYLVALKEENLLDNCRAMGDYLLEGFKGLMDKHAIIGDVRGRGLFAGIEIVKDRATKEPIAEPIANAMVGAAKANGVLIGKTSRSFRGFNNTLTFCPALISTKSDIEEIVAGVDKAFTDVEKKFGL